MTAATLNRLATVRLELVEVSGAGGRLIVRGEPPRGQVWTEGYPLEGTVVAARMLLRGIEAGSYRPASGCTSSSAAGPGQFSATPASTPDRMPTGTSRSATASPCRTVGWAWSRSPSAPWSPGGLPQPGVRRVVADTDRGAVASQRVLARAGSAQVASSGDELRYAVSRAT